MREPNSCPKCKTSLVGEPIPLESQALFGATHFMRVFGISDGDSVGYWQCPDCSHTWEREGALAYQARENLRRHMATDVELQHARLLQNARSAGMTIKDISRAMASIDVGEDQEFQALGGDYSSYLPEAVEMIKRATQYAIGRKAQAKKREE